MAKEFFLAVKESVDIIDVISHYVPLTKIGNYYKGISPFKSEKTPSFTVTPEKKIFYCFSTHIGGDTIDFVARMENCSQYEAACLLIERYGLPIKKTSFGIDKEEIKKENHYFTIHQLFNEFCQKKLLQEVEALSYLKERGINKTSLIKFNIGYCPGAEAAIKEFIDIVYGKGLLKDEIKKAHIFQENKAKKTFFIAEKRIIFPITNQINLACGYGARIFKQGDDRAKYINSMSSSEFSKKNLLYNFNQAKSAIRKTKEVFFVEGFLDVILMDQAGYANTVATMGTAPTEHHIELIKKFTENIVIMYDGDTAGRNAILKFIHLCWNQEIDVSVIILPPDEDPASLVQKNKIHEIIEKRVSAIDFFIGEKKENLKNKSLKETSEILEELLHVLSNIKDEKKQEIIKLKTAMTLGIESKVIDRLLLKEPKKIKVNEGIPKKESTPPVKEKKNDWYLFFHLTLFFYDPLDREIQQGIRILQYMLGEKIAPILESFLSSYKTEAIDYLEFLKKNNEKAYQHAIKLINTYSFSKNQYQIILSRMTKETWAFYLKTNKKNSFAEFLLFLENK